MKFLLLLGAFLLAFTGLSQIDTLWTKVYGGTGNEPVGLGSGYAGAPAIHAEKDISGNIYLVTYTESADNDIHLNKGLEDVWLLKLDPNGDTLWTRTIGGSSYDRAYRVRVTSDQGCIVVGRTASNDGDFTGNHGSEDAFIVKVDETGGIEWSMLYGGSQIDNFFGVEVIGNRLLCYGATGSVDGDVPPGNAGSIEAWILFLDNYGNIIWSEKTSASTLNLDWSENFWSAAELNDGFVLAGMTGDAFDFNTDDFFLAKYDTLGTQVWYVELGSDISDAIGGVAVLNNEIYLSGRVGEASGNVMNYAGGSGDIWLAKLDSNGTLIHEQNYGGTDYEYPYNIQISQDHKVMVTGVTRSVDGDLTNSSFGGFDFWMFKTDTALNVIEDDYRFGGLDNDYAHGVIETGSNDFIIYGRSMSDVEYVPFNYGGTDIYLAKIQSLPNNVGLVLEESQVFGIYPNPNTGEFKIINGFSGQNYSLLNAQGELIENGIYNGHSIHLNVSSGMYFLNIQDAVYKLILE